MAHDLSQLPADLPVPADDGALIERRATGSALNVLNAVLTWV